MAEFGLQIEGTIRAQNLDSANRKLEEIKDWLARHGVEMPEIRLKGNDPTLSP